MKLTKTLFGLFLFIFCIFISPSVNAANLLANEKIFWQGNSDGFKITWTNKDLKVTKDDRIIYSALREMRKAVKELTGSHGTDTEQSVRLLSVVGHFLSFQYHYYSIPLGADGMIESAHPGGQTVYITIDLCHIDTPISKLLKGDEQAHGPQLQSIFSPSTLINALRQDEIINTSLSEDSLKSFNTFQAALNDYSPLASKWCGTMDPQLLNAFCFHHIAGTKVAVRIGISGAGPCRENLTEIGILLPIPQKFIAAFLAAKNGKNGCLAIELQKNNPKALTKYDIRVFHK